MAGIDQAPASIIDPTLERAQRVERAVIHVTRAIELELADIALSGESLDPESTQAQSLRQLGAVLLRVSSMGIHTANSLATTLGDTPQEISEIPKQTLIPQAVAPQSASSEVRSQEAAEPAEVAAPVVETPVVATPPSGSTPTPETSRLTRKQNIDTSDSVPTPRVTRGREKQKIQYEGELYTRIVSEKQTPVMELREGMEPIPIRIITDDTLVINGEKVVLEGDQLFIFNALMKLRDGMITAKDMREFGFRIDGPSASATFSKAMTGLMGELQQAAGPEQPTIIKKIGQAAGVKYAVNPAVILEDERIHFSGDVDDDTSEIVKKN